MADTQHGGQPYPAPPPAKRAWYQKKRYVIPLALIAVIIVATALSGGGNGGEVETVAPTADTETTEPQAESGVQSSSTNREHPPQDDVTVTSCEEGDFGVTADVEVVNHSPERSNYLISINLLDESGTRVGDAFTAVNNVDPGQRATAEAFGTGEGVETCELVEVERYAS